MQYSISPNGNLVFTLDQEERDEWRAKMEEPDTYMDIEIIFGETGLAGNCDISTTSPESVGALTDSPIFGQDPSYDDDDELEGYLNVWWYPNYQVENPAEVLITTGTVTFTAAPENEKTNHTVMGDDNVDLFDGTYTECKDFITRYTKFGDFGGHSALTIFDPSKTVIHYTLNSDGTSDQM
jgi:hypothetical protein